MLRIARKLSRLSAVEWRDLLGAEGALLRAQLAVWLRPRGRLAMRSRGGKPPGPEGEVEPEVRSLALALRRAASHGPIRPACLVRAIALARLLEARGHGGAQVRIGVRREGERAVAHAWVEYRGVVLADEPWHVGRFHEFPDLDVSL